MALLMLQDRGRAKEVTQDVFLKVWRALPGYDGRASPSTWLYTIARNTCLSALRSATHRRTTPLDETPSQACRVRSLAISRSHSASRRFPTSNGA